MHSPNSQRIGLSVPSDEAIESEIQKYSPHGIYPETPSGMTTQELMRHMARFVLRNVAPIPPSGPAESECQRVLRIIATTPTTHDGKWIENCAGVFQQMAKTALKNAAPQVPLTAGVADSAPSSEGDASPARASSEAGADGLTFEDGVEAAAAFVASQDDPWRAGPQDMFCVADDIRSQVKRPAATHSEGGK